MTYRIHRSAAADKVVFLLSGDMDTEHVTRLQEFLANEDGRVTFDLKDVTLVGRAAVRFLADSEADGVRIVNCPDYVRSWIAAERNWPPDRAPKPDEQELQP